MNKIIKKVFSKDVVSSKAKDHQWRSLMEKSTKRNKNDKFSEENVKEIFHTIDKDNSGEITMKVISVIQISLRQHEHRKQ